MPYGSLPLAERNARPGFDFRVTDERWDIVTRSLRRYEEGVRRYFGHKNEKGIWVRDLYIMHGDQGPLGCGEWYVGILRSLEKLHGWRVASLSDRNEEGLGVGEMSIFDLA
ncbi:hypothetical protein V5T06_08135 [Corynebacterium mastitidis]